VNTQRKCVLVKVGVTFETGRRLTRELERTVTCDDFNPYIQEYLGLDDRRMVHVNREMVR